MLEPTIIVTKGGFDLLAEQYKVGLVRSPSSTVICTGILAWCQQSERSLNRATVLVGPVTPMKAVSVLTAAAGRFSRGVCLLIAPYILTPTFAGKQSLHRNAVRRLLLDIWVLGYDKFLVRSLDSAN